MTYNLTPKLTKIRDTVKNIQTLTYKHIDTYSMIAICRNIKNTNKNTYTKNTITQKNKKNTKIYKQTKPVTNTETNKKYH